MIDEIASSVVICDGCGKRFKWPKKGAIHIISDHRGAYACRFITGTWGAQGGDAIGNIINLPPRQPLWKRLISRKARALHKARQRRIDLYYLRYEANRCRFERAMNDDDLKHLAPWPERGRGPLDGEWQGAG